MLDIKFIRENPDAVRENIKKKFQDAKLPPVSYTHLTPSAGPPLRRRISSAPTETHSASRSAC